MTVAELPEPDPDNEAALMAEVKTIIDGAQDDVTLEAYFTLAIKVGQYLVSWRKMMRDGNFTDQWVEEAAMDIFNRFFKPFVADTPMFGMGVINDSGD